MPMSTKPRTPVCKCGMDLSAIRSLPKKCIGCKHRDYGESIRTDPHASDDGENLSTDFWV